MKIFPHLFDKLFCQPLMLLGSVRYGLEAELLAHMGLSPTARQGSATLGDQAAADEDWLRALKVAEATKKTWRVERIYQTVGNVGVVSIGGVIDKHLSNADLDCYGGCDLADVDKALAAAAADPKIERVVLAVNSPGGSVVGVPETAARVAAMRASKEVHAFVDGMAASAAYYIASQADTVQAAPSALLGSVGVYCTILDQTRALEMKGVKAELIRAGKYKAMGSPLRQLTDEERGMIQGRVDRLHAQFRGAVNSQRPKVKTDAMEGQTFDGQESLEHGLADGLFSGNLDEYVAGLLG